MAETSWNQSDRPTATVVKITRATVLLQPNGADMVFLHTELPPTMPKVSTQSPSLKFEVEAGQGIEYVRKVIGIEPWVQQDTLNRRCLPEKD